jgi:DNA-binding CsgD family transcriptional regulator
MTGSKERDQLSAELDAPASSVKTRKKSDVVFSSKPLSAKELEILCWATKGKTVWEISRIRAISPATVKFHLRNIYCKLQVGNRVQAAAEAVKRGLCN